MFVSISIWFGPFNRICIETTIQTRQIRRKKKQIEEFKNKQEMDAMDCRLHSKMLDTCLWSENIPCISLTHTYMASVLSGIQIEWPHFQKSSKNSANK